LEWSAIAAIQWSWQVVALFVVFALCLFSLYALVPVILLLTSATVLNLSMLTADFFSVLAGVYLFHYTVCRASLRAQPGRASVDSRLIGQVAAAGVCSCRTCTSSHSP
jgi:hypothetical protein